MKRVVPKFDHFHNPIGIVISNHDGTSPNTNQFSFILTEAAINKGYNIQQGQYCIVDSIEGNVIGVIEELYVDNQYFSNHQTIKNYNMANINLQTVFPSDQWECHIANVKVIGLVNSLEKFSQIIDPITFRKISKVGFPAKPGNNVFLLNKEYLINLLGLNESGLKIGMLNNYNQHVQLDVDRLFNKHLAILAQSGAGKSYLISVLLEELLLRPQEKGTPAMILFDVHGEYKFLKYKQKDMQDEIKKTLISNIQTKIQSFNASFLQIAVPDLTEYDFRRYQPAISLPQLRELRKAIMNCRKKFCIKHPISENNEENTSQGYDINDIVSVLNEDLESNTKVKDTLIGWLEDLNHLGIFGKIKAPKISELVRIGELSIIDLSTMISQRKKQILIEYFTSLLFKWRRSKRIPPFIIFLEEAHNFLPEKSGNSNITKYIFETIAREGRKFFAQLVLVSQRPVHLSTTALSQCNTQIIMRVTNPYDQNHIKSTSEALTQNSAKIISTLPTGSALVMGAALNFPIFIKVRKRLINNIAGEKTLSDMSRSYVKDI